jgi:hypothetical protein
MESRLRTSILKRQESKGGSVDVVPGEAASFGPFTSNPAVSMESKKDASPVPGKLHNHLGKKSLEEMADRPSKSKTKIITLSAHLQKKNKRRSSRKNKARYGDELSLGTAQLSKLTKLSNVENELDEPDSVLLNQEATGRIVEKSDRPWVYETEARVVELYPPVNPPRKDENQTGPPIVDKFFNSSNQHVFDRSVFNFNHSFSSKLSLVNEDDGSRSKLSLSESESVASGKLAKGDEVEDIINESVEADDAISLLESLSSYVSLSEEKYIFETPDYESIETRLAEKLRSKEAEFDAAWENIVADEHVAAQINQRLRERQRTKRIEKAKEDKEEEASGYYDVPRLFLFEGEKNKRKKKKRRKNKDRKLQKN